MSDNKSIHEFDFNLICEYFSGLERQGPGSPEATVKALGFIEGLNDRSRIADLGCGTGGQTMVLARHTDGCITGIDLFPAFVDLFNASATRLGYNERVKAVTGSMDDLPFQDEELDLIWSEGAIYNIGFERGLNYWKRFLRKGGYLAVSEASWFTDERPEEITGFWMDAYPGIETIPNQTARIQKAGYVPVAHFILPEYCWTDNFYALQVELQKAFLEKHTGNTAADDLVANARHEAQLYSKYKKYYGYVFFICRKI